MVEYEEFVEFHKKHPDLDNTEYYAEFPETNKSTIRSWKSRAAKPVIETPMPTKQEAEEKGKGYEDIAIDALCAITKTNPKSISMLSPADQIAFLKNKRDNLDSQEPDDKVKRGSNASILPIPKPIGSNARKFGIDEYIAFDGVKNEIRMEIPMTVLFDPEKNRGLGEIK